MSISMLLEMAVSAGPDRIAISCDGADLRVVDIDRISANWAQRLAQTGAESVAYVGTGGEMLPLTLFAAARAGLPFSPLNYRLGGEQLSELIDRLPTPVVVADAEYMDVAGAGGAQVIASGELLASGRDGLAGDVAGAVPGPDDSAVVLFTSGTTSRPKAVQLSHQNLSSYILGTVEFASAGTEDAALICVPPYHIAGVSAALSNLYAGRRMVYMRRFDAGEWVELARTQEVSHATVVPTMLDRIVDVLEADPIPLPVLRTLAYGGSTVPLPLVRRTLDLLPETGLVNAYGLTETSSTIAVLTPDDHRLAYESSDPDVRRRLGSVGRPVPGVEVQIRGDDGRVLGPGTDGELFIRGPQVSGHYAEIGSVLDEQGWFPTKDVASIDSGGYLFIGGRADDTIIRGGENIAPAELEDVLVEHPDVHAVAVVGIPDPEWGQALVAVVVPANATPEQATAAETGERLRDHVRRHLRGSRTPDRVVFRDELPATPTGKLLRRVLVDELHTERASTV